MTSYPYSMGHGQDHRGAGETLRAQNLRRRSLQGHSIPQPSQSLSVFCTSMCLLPQHIVESGEGPGGQ